MLKWKMLLNQTKIELTDCSSILSNASPKSTPDRLISFLSGYSLSLVFWRSLLRMESKWKDRTGCGGYQSLLAWPCPVKYNAILPRHVQTFINLFRSLCKEHKSCISNPDHIKKFHNPEFPTYETILSKLESMTAYILSTREGKSNYSVYRLATLELNKNYVNNLVSCILELTSSRTISTFNVCE